MLLDGVHDDRRVVEVLLGQDGQHVDERLAVDVQIRQARQVLGLDLPGPLIHGGLVERGSSHNCTLNSSPTTTGKPMHCTVTAEPNGSLTRSTLSCAHSSDEGLASSGHTNLTLSLSFSHTQTFFLAFLLLLPQLPPKVVGCGSVYSREQLLAGAQ